MLIRSEVVVLFLETLLTASQYLIQTIPAAKTEASVVLEIWVFANFPSLSSA